MRIAPIGRLVAALAFLACGLPARAAPDPAPAAPQGDWKPAITLMGAPKYGPGFKHFDYADPNAPKGGLVRLGAQGGFDNFNIVVSGLKGDLEGGVAQIYDTLTTESPDEPFTSYGLLAEASGSRRLSAVSYRLSEDARWHDGKPVTPEDVIWSFDVLRGTARSTGLLPNVTKAEATGPREVTFTFSEAGNRELPQVVGQLRVLPKHWWTGTDAQGRARDVTETTLEPAGSGPTGSPASSPGAAPPTSGWPITGAGTWA